MLNKIRRFFSVLFLAAAVFCGTLLFFTDLTKNPFFIQIIVVNISLFIFILLNPGSFTVNKIDRLFLLFCAAAVLSWGLSLALNARYALNIFYNFLNYGIILITWMLAYAAGKIVSRKYNFGLVPHMFFAAGFAAAVYGIIQTCGIEPFWPPSVQIGVVSTFGNPNFLSSFLLMLLFPAAYYFFENKKRRFFCGGIIFVYALFMILSGARSSILAAAAGIFLFALHKPFFSKIIEEKKIIFICLSAFIFVFFLLPSSSKGVIYNKAKELTGMRRAGLTQSYDQRFMLWGGAGKFFKESPVTGKGWGNFALNYGNYQGGLILKNNELSVFRTQGNNTHNFIFQLLAETGIAGFLLFISFLGLLFFYALKDRRGINIVLAISLAAMLVDNMLNITLFITAPAFLFWFLCGVLSENVLCGAEVKINKYSLICAWFLFILFAVVNIKIFLAAADEYKALKAFSSKNYYASLNYVNRSLKYYKGSHEAWFMKGNIETALKDNSAAYLSFSRAARLNPAYEEPYFNAAVTAYALGNYGDVKENISAALNLNPLREFSYILLANSCAELKELRPREEERLERGLLLFPENMMLCVNSGDAYAAVKSPKAAEIFEDCVKKDTLDKNALLKLSSAAPESEYVTRSYLAQQLNAMLAKKGRPSANVISGVNLYAENYPEDPNSLVMLARLKYNDGDFEAAREILSSALQKYPRNEFIKAALQTVNLQIFDKN